MLRRLLRDVVVASSVVLAAAAVYAAVRLHFSYGFDFHGGIWRAGHDILAGRSPYGPPDAHRLASLGNAYIPPPLLAEVLLPLSLLPVGVAMALLNLICVCALVLGLRLAGVRDGAVYLVCLCSGAFMFSLLYGDPDAIYVLLGVITWRRRESWIAALAVGALIAMKLLLWPLLIWFAATRRLRSAGVALATAFSLIVVGWAAISFHGLRHYLQFLAADSQVQSTNHSLVAVIRSLGVSRSPAAALALALALAAGFAVAIIGRRTDLAWFSAAVITGLLATPVVFPNYFLILLVPIAVSRRSLDAVWLLFVGFWAYARVRGGTWEVSVELLLAVGLAAAAARSRHGKPLIDAPGQIRTAVDGGPRLMEARA